LKGTAVSFAALGTLLIKIVIPASLGITLGSLVYYAITFKLGRPFIERTGRYLRVSVEDVEQVETQFKKSKYGDLYIFLARCVPIVPSIAVNLFCGMVRYDLKKYLVTTFFGSMVQIFGWGLLAWLFGNIYQVLEDKISFLGNAVTLIIILMVIYFLIQKKRGVW
jgi:membrane protein DedA with SNARE-associated domain